MTSDRGSGAGALRRALLAVVDPATRTSLRWEAIRHGCSVEEVASCDEARARLQAGPYDVVAADLDLPGALDFLREGPGRERIAILRHEGAHEALVALRCAAAAYLLKPLQDLDVRSAWTRLDRPASGGRGRSTDASSPDDAVGQSPGWREVLDLVAQIAPTESTVLLTGESGTGKEVVAKMLHRASDRRDAPFVTLNCAALSATVLESELFGHERGAFTGAVSTRQGRFEHAHGGTLFLDEVGDMPLGVQAKLLRVIEERTVTRVGSNEVLPIDVRVVAASHRPLERLVREGAFREDLYFRLKVLTIHLPPLRERRTDIPLLVDHFRRIFAAASSRPVRRIAPRAMDALVRYDWPGNVRELRHAVESMVVLARGDVLDVADIPEDVVRRAGARLPPGSGTVADTERHLVERTLAACAGRRREAARRLGMAERTLYRRIRAWGLGVRGRPDAGPGRRR